MRTVWKYSLDLIDQPQIRQIPIGARIVHVGNQYDTPTLWIECKPSNELEDCWFIVHGTGHPIEHNGHWIGTVITHKGEFVWHIYKVDRRLA